MKKIITTTLIITILAFSNILTSNAEKYRATETNSEGQVITVTISEGKNDKITEPLKQYRMKYDENGTLSEKQLYRWNSSQSKWEASIIYQYEYNRSNQLAELQYSKWDNKNSSWYNTKHTLFSDQLNEKLIAINYLDTLK